MKRTEVGFGPFATCEFSAQAKYCGTAFDKEGSELPLAALCTNDWSRKVHKVRSSLRT